LSAAKCAVFPDLTHCILFDALLDRGF